MRVSPLLVLTALPLAAALSFAAAPAPSPDLPALRRTAADAHQRMTTATMLPLEPEKAATIKAGIDDAAAAGLAVGDAAKALDALQLARSVEMDAFLDKRPAEAARDVSEKAAHFKRRLERQESRRAELAGGVAALPDKDEAGKPNAKKRALEAALARAAAELETARFPALKGEEAARIMTDAAAKAADARRRARTPDGERAAAVAAALRASAGLPAAAAEAKERVDGLSAEPREVSRTRAQEKLAAARELTRALFSGVDAACNRAEDFERFFGVFASSAEAFESAREAFARLPAEAKAALERADGFLDEVRRGLGR